MPDELRVEVQQVGASTSEAVMRGHVVRIDRPVAKGGADEGAMGGELLLASLGGCFMSTLLAAIRAREVAVSGVRVEVCAVQAGAPPRFSRIELVVSADAEDEALLRKLVTIAQRSCLVANTLRQAVDLSVSVRAGALPDA